MADTGGSIGVWHFFPSLEGYVDGLKEMADVVGADHDGGVARPTGMFLS